MLAHDGSDHDANSIIVKFVEGLSGLEKDIILSEFGCLLMETCEPGQFHLIRIPEGVAPEIMVTGLAAETAVEYAELNHQVSIFFVPDDPYYSFQWNLDNDSTGGINTQTAWDLQQGDPNVIVAVLDTGVAFENYAGFLQAPDLAQTPFVPGYDFVEDDVHPNDDEGHGTHVTGTIAQSTNNELGVAGVAFGCSIMPVKVLDNEGVGDHFNIAEGIYFAVEHGARVINMSFGGAATSRTLRNAVAFAYEQGVTIVCAAGNDYLEGNATSYPAAYDDYCISVGAVRYDNTRAYYSSTGPHIDLAAPGGDVTVDQNHDGYPDGVLQQTFTLDPTDFAYYFFQGTSMATPHVSGVAALLVSRGVTEPDKVREAMEMTARDVGPVGWDMQYGWGIVDAGAALSYRVPGDIDGDNLVDAADLFDFCNLWLSDMPQALVADFNADGNVGFPDYVILAGNWLQ